MYRYNAFLVDISYLQYLSDEINVKNLEFSIESFRRVLNRTKELHITFGVFKGFGERITPTVCYNKFFSFLLKLIFNIKKFEFLKSRYNIECFVKYNHVHGDDRKKYTGVVFYCADFRIQVSYFHERGNFLWIGKFQRHRVKSFKWFGDRPRAVQK